VAKFILAFFQKYETAKGVEKRPKITNLASKKPNWQLRPALAFFPSIFILRYA